MTYQELQTCMRCLTLSFLANSLLSPNMLTSSGLCLSSLASSSLVTPSNSQSSTESVCQSSKNVSLVLTFRNPHISFSFLPPLEFQLAFPASWDQIKILGFCFQVCLSIYSFLVFFLTLVSLPFHPIYCIDNLSIINKSG